MVKMYNFCLMIGINTFEEMIGTNTHTHMYLSLISNGL